MLFGMVSRPGLAVKLLGSGDERFSITGSLGLLGWTEADPDALISLVQPRNRLKAPTAHRCCTFTVRR